MKSLALLAAFCGALALTAVAARAEGKVKIALVGDSSADGLWGGITRIVTRDACLKEQLEILRLAKNGTGLTRPEKMDWVAEVGRIAEKDKPALFVISLGLNDRQSIVAAGQTTALDSPQYGERYQERVADMIKAASGAGVIWVSLAAMREAPANADALAKNKLFAAAAAATGAQFVDRRTFNLVGGDTFNSYGPDKSGSMIQIRQADGVHFTPAGEDMVAAELLPKILGNLRQRNVPGMATCQK
ncbi:MAG: uncharacterized protein QOG38_1790 [Hyphomicrobiales bacterium]|jgi:hypothetical protein|nr:uncharacterized protein [Hyphomicrobiales bacterium]